MNSFFSMDSPIMRFLSRVCDLMILNILFIFCCIPVVTIGTSLTALYSVTLKMAKGEESYIFKGFLKAFKENFKQSLVIWLIMALLGALLYVDFRAAALLPQNFKNIFSVFIGAIFVMYAIVFVYAFPYTARFVNTVKNIFKNSLLIAILNLPWTIFLLAVPAALVFITFLNSMTMVYGVMLWLLLGFATVAYINSVVLRTVFAKYEPKDEEITDTLSLSDETSDDTEN